MRVLFFAQTKDATKCDSIELHPSSPMNCEEFWAEILKNFPKLAAHRASVRLAKNSEYAGTNAQFFDTDEIALIPPVSGG